MSGTGTENHWAPARAQIKKYTNNEVATRLLCIQQQYSCGFTFIDTDKSFKLRVGHSPAKCRSLAVEREGLVSRDVGGEMYIIYMIILVLLVCAYLCLYVRMLCMHGSKEWKNWKNLIMSRPRGPEPKPRTLYCPVGTPFP